MQKPGCRPRTVALRTSGKGKVAARHVDIAVMIDHKHRGRVARALHRKLAGFDDHISYDSKRCRITCRG
ncbi:MAG: hypothetical protein ALAOOOJD_02678 [bacterium]|nr:hypothetical protein [bacterium]